MIITSQGEEFGDSTQSCDLSAALAEFSLSLLCCEVRLQSQARKRAQGGTVVRKKRILKLPIRALSDQCTLTVNLAYII